MQSLWKASWIQNVINGEVIKEVDKESIAHLNGTLVSLFDNFGEQSLHSLFRVRPLHFVTRTRALRVLEITVEQKLNYPSSDLYLGVFSSKSKRFYFQVLF